MWNDLTMSERADVIKMAVKAGLRDMKSIRNFYDNSLKYADGGPKVTLVDNDKVRMSPSGTFSDDSGNIIGDSIVLPEISVRPTTPQTNDKSYYQRWLMRQASRGGKNMSSNDREAYDKMMHRIANQNEVNNFTGFDSTIYNHGNGALEQVSPEFDVLTLGRQFYTDGLFNAVGKNIIKKGKNTIASYDLYNNIKNGKINKTNIPSKVLYRTNVYRGGKIKYPKYSFFTTDEKYASQYGKVNPYIFESKNIAVAKEPLMGYDDPVNRDMMIYHNIKDNPAANAIIGYDKITGEFPYQSRGAEILNLDPHNIFPIKVNNSNHNVYIFKKPYSLNKPISIEKWTPEQWTAAQDAAIARGDMIEAQRLRDLHFQVNAPNTQIKDIQYHGAKGDAKFNVFDPELIGQTDKGWAGKGYYFTPSEDYAKMYGSEPRAFYINAQKVHDGKAAAYFGRENGPEANAFKIIRKRHNNDGQQILDELASSDAIRTSFPQTQPYNGIFEEVVTRNNNQMKLADAVTYNDNGIRIPLGLRDNFKNKDIRYSISLEDALSNPNFDFSSTGAPRSFWEIMNLRRPSIASEKWKKVANQKLLDSKELDGAVNILQSTWYKKRLLSQGMSEAQANNLIKQQVSNIKATNVILGDPGTGFGMQAGGKTVTVNGKTTIYVPEGYTSQVATHEGLHSSTGNGSILDIKNKVLTPNWSKETNPNYYDYISNPDEQRVRLLKLADYVEQHGGDYVKVINDLKSNSHGIGKPKVDSDFNDLFGSFNIGDIIEAAKNVKSIAVPLTIGGTALSTNKKAEGGSIHIAPSKRGTFTAAATKHGMGVQEFASKVLANKDNYSSAMVKKANFAKNASKWNHGLGGYLFI